MKKIFTLIFILFTLSTFAQVGTAVSVPLGAWPYYKPMWVQLPSGYTPGVKYPVIFFFHGSGESSGTGATDATYQAGGYLNKIYTSTSSGGPTYPRENGWDGSATVGGTNYKFIIVSPQSTSWSTPGDGVSVFIDYVKANYSVDTNRIYITGLSAGGQTVQEYMSGMLQNTSTTSTPISNMSTLPAAAVPMSIAGYMSTAGQSNGTVADSVHAWGFGGNSDGLGENTVAWMDSLNVRKAGIARKTLYVGGHGGWNAFYDPSYTENIGGTNMNIYQWMLQFSRAPSGSVAAPTVYAGTDITTTANNVSLSGTVTPASGHSVTYLWTKTSGGSATIVSPTSISTTITGLSVGTYVFRLTGTQDDAQTAYDELTVIVNAAPTFTVNAGTDQTIPSTQNAVLLQGTCSDSTATTVWRLINPISGHDEIGKMQHTRSLTTGVMTLPVDWHGTYSYELACTVGATTIKDTVNINTTWDFSHTPQASPPIRMATSTDVTNFPGISLGDAMVVGANDGPAYLVATGYINIYSVNPAGITVAAGKHIWLMPGVYNEVQLKFDGSQLQGTKNNPITITNYGGQFQCRQLILSNLGDGCNLTGKYVAGVSGNINYKGHDSSYAFSRGKYGIWINNYWQSLSTSNLSLSEYNKNLNINYVETGDGGFAGVIMNVGNGNEWHNINFNNLYVHNTDGEGNYLGNTGDTSVARNYFTNSSYFNNRVLYSGNELLQWGQNGDSNKIYNNVLMGGGLRWKTSFESYYQANSLQWGLKSGSNQFVNNILRGSGDQNLNIFYQPYSGVPIIGDSNIVANNYVGDSRSFLGNYINILNALGTKYLSVRDNYFSNYNFQGDSAYATSASAGVNTNTLLKFENSSNTDVHVTLKNNTSDASKTAYQFGNTTSIVQSGNTQATIYKPVFVNSGWDDNFDWTRLEAWTDSLFATYGDEYGDLSGTKAPKACYYQTGDWVTFQSKYYQSLVDNNTGHMPLGYTDAYWQKITWTDGVKTYDYPPDDFRLQTGDIYNVKGIGLLDNMSAPGALPILIRNFIVTKHKFKDGN